MKAHQSSKLFLVTLFALALSACGGGGGSSSNDNPSNPGGNTGNTPDTSFTKGSTSVPGLNAPENVSIVDAK